MSPVSGQQSQNGSNGTSVPDGARSIFRTEARRQDQQVRAHHEQHEAKRPRKLLLHRREIDKMRAASEIKGSTLVALRLYWKNRRVKVEIGAGKGKVHQDRREDLKKRTVQREVDREMARFNRR